ncbi:DUF3164 family protein [Humitalea sp. 24SJ18S-53]|uniref:DUF3164 family protein n=1 Tax=Humitalea sp. 24SJ18S-53 TaxID=3422307 RepID=UPI003D6719ED
MAATDTTPQIPEGFRADAAGRLIPIASIKPEHLLEDELVQQLHGEALVLNHALLAFRAGAFERIRAYVALLEQHYGAKRGGKKGNLTLSSFDGALRVQLAVGEYIGFGPELQIAKQLVDECLRAWSEGANDNLRAIVNDAFQVDREGKVNADRILTLRRLAITDPVWQRAMEAIGDAIRVTSSKEYIRFHARPTPESEHVMLALDIARV